MAEKKYFLPNYIISEMKTRYAESTVKRYDNAIRYIYKGAFDSPRFHDYYLFSTADVIKYISKQKSKQVPFSAVMAVIRSLKPIPEIAEQVYEKNRRKFHGRTEYKPPTETELSDYVTLYNMAQMAKSVGANLPTEIKTKGDYNRWLTWFIMYWYSFMPPLRAQELASLSFDKNSPNHIDINNWTIVLRKHKTVRSHGMRTMVIPKFFRKVIVKWREINKHGMLLVNFGGKPITANYLTKLISRSMGRSLVTIRKIYVYEYTTYFKTLKLAPANYLDHRKTLARTLGHTIETQELVYNAYNMTHDLDNSPKEYMNIMYGTWKTLMPTYGYYVCD